MSRMSRMSRMSSRMSKGSPMMMTVAMKFASCSAALLAGAVVVGCTPPPVVEDPPIIDDRAQPTPFDGNGIELRQPPMQVEPGKDLHTCWVPEFVPDTDLIVKKSLAFQGTSGHHVAVFGSVIPRQPGEVFDCTALESMATMSPLIIPDLPNVTNERILPDGFAVRVPAGQTIVVQSHIINANLKPIEISDVVQLQFAEPDEELIEASYWVLTDNTVVVPPGESVNTKSCEIPEDTQMIYLLGHMHERGAGIVVEHEDGATGNIEEVYRVDEWTSEFRDNGPTVAFPPDAPHVFKAGDRVDLTCEYNNPTNDELRWPSEMCVAFGAYFPSRGDGFIICD